jgi:hypothetical protein
MQLGCATIVANPEHLDFDWFAPVPADHWWNEATPGTDIEIAAAVAIMNYLEDSLGLAQSAGGNPATWTWPPGTAATSRRKPTWTRWFR